MEIRILGSGDAAGTPHVGCTCKNCTYAHNTGIERLRTSLLITHQDHNLIIDTTPDMRRQLLQAGSPRIDAVIWTHGHYDHFMGFGDFYRVQSILQYTVPRRFLSHAPRSFISLSGKNDQSGFTRRFLPVDLRLP